MVSPGLNFHSQQVAQTYLVRTQPCSILNVVQKREPFASIGSSFVSPELEWHFSHTDIAGVTKRQAGFRPNPPAHTFLKHMHTMHVRMEVEIHY